MKEQIDIQAIEEMANDIDKSHWRIEQDWRGCNLNSSEIAEHLYNAGYRKQSAWISVDERLPTWKDGKVLIHTRYGISIAQKTTTNHWKGDNAIPKLITHWMPLPEPPKGE